jgi:hypothetical protein
MRLRAPAPLISDLATIRSGFERIAMMLPSMQGDDSCHDLEHGAAMWGITTDAKLKQTLWADQSSNAEFDCGAANRPARAVLCAAGSVFPRDCSRARTLHSRGLFADLKSPGCAGPRYHASPKQLPPSGPHPLGSRSLLCGGTSRPVGSSGTGEETRDTFTTGCALPDLCSAARTTFRVSGERVVCGGQLGRRRSRTGSPRPLAPRARGCTATAGQRLSQSSTRMSAVKVRGWWPATFCPTRRRGHVSFKAIQLL